MTRVAKHARKIVVSLIGFPLLVLGVILIPVPGPGFLLSFLALLILSLEFDWAHKYLHKAKQEFKKVYDKAKARSDKIENLGSKKDKNNQ